MVHILITTFLFEPDVGGGAASVPYCLAQELVSKGYKVSVITSSPYKRNKSEQMEGINIYKLPPFNLYWVYDKENKPLFQKIIWQLIDTWNPFVFKQTKTIIQQIEPDLIHVHKLRGLSPSVWSAAAACVIPVVHTCHDYELISPQGTLSGKIGKLALNRSILLRPYQSIRRQASRAVTAFTAPSNKLLQKHLNFGFFSNASHRVIPNSHGYSDTQLVIFEANNLERRNESPLRILFLGRVHEEKGVQDLLQAFFEAYNENHGVTLDIAGEGPLLADLKKQFGEHPAIHFHGHVKGEEKERLFEQCDVVIFPSRVQEGLGIVILEAFAHGKPVIASRCGGPEEIVENGVTGFLFDISDNSKLKELIINAANHPEVIFNLRTNCYSRAKKYCLGEVINSYESLYLTLVKKNEK